MSFALDLQKFAEKTKGKADDAVGNIVARIATEIDKRSPVGDATYWKNPAPKGYTGGRFRGNWQLGVGVMPVGETGRTDKTGETVNTIISEIPDEAAGKIYWLANNTPYSQRIEDGWSRQAPNGVVGLTVTMYEQIVREVVAQL